MFLGRSSAFQYFSCFLLIILIRIAQLQSYGKRKGELVTLFLVPKNTADLYRLAVQFTQSRKPLDLHKSVQLVVLSHNAQAQAGGLYLKAELDPEIDKLGGTFISDEMRIR